MRKNCRSLLLASLALTERVERYAAVGRALVEGDTTVAESVAQLHKALA